MYDVALSNSGAQVVLATSHDDKHPAENIIDGSTESFWMSTGLFPQDFVISFASMMNVKALQVHCHNVRRMELERSTKKDPVGFEPITMRELESTDGRLQDEEVDLGNVTAAHLRFKITSGYDHFISVHKVSVEGSAVNS